MGDLVKNLTSDVEFPSVRKRVRPLTQIRKVKNEKTRLDFEGLGLLIVVQPSLFYNLYIVLLHTVSFSMGAAAHFPRDPTSGKSLVYWSRVPGRVRPI